MWLRLGDINTGTCPSSLGESQMRIKYGREFYGTSTQKWLRWKGPKAIVQVNYRPILSSKRVPDIKKPAIVREIKEIWSWDPDGIPAPRQTGRLTVGRKLISTSTSVEPIETAVARHRLGKDFSSAKNTRAAIYEMCGAMFSLRSVSFQILVCSGKNSRRLVLLRTSCNGILPSTSRRH
jgi:hypothetical protein